MKMRPAFSGAKRRQPQGIDDKIIGSLAYILSILVLVLTLYPLLYVVSASFSDPASVTRGDLVLLPILPTLDGYATILEYKPIWIGYRNTIFYTFAGTLINLACTLPCAYALSRKDMKGRSALMFLFTFTMFFNGGMIPTYLMMKRLAILNTVWAMLIPGAVSVYNLIIARTYFASSIPHEISEAAMIDGCSNTRLFATIILPLSMPMVAVIMLYYAVTHWNSYFNALIYLANDQLYPLQLYLRNILLEDMMLDLISGDSEAMEAMIRRLQLKESMQYGIVVISSLPVLILYPFIQKYFAKGVMIGAIKG